MLPIFADSFLTATRLSEPTFAPDYRRLHPQPPKGGDRKLSKSWFFLS